MLYPSHHHWGLLTALLVDLENIHRHTVSEFLRCHRALRRGKRAMIDAWDLIRGN